MSTAATTTHTSTHKPLYVFLDEGGNLDFSTTGTPIFTLTGIWLPRPFPCDNALTNLRFDLIEEGLDIEYFHASEDRQATRDRVFSILQPAHTSFSASSVIIEKARTPPNLRDDVRFYPHALGLLLRDIIALCLIEQWSELIVVTDRIPVSRKRNAVEKAVRMTLSRMLPPEIQYRVLHHDSKSCAGLQIADYFNWAIYRAHIRGDHRSINLIQPAIRLQRRVFTEDDPAWY